MGWDGIKAFCGGKGIRFAETVLLVRNCGYAKLGILVGCE